MENITAVILSLSALVAAITALIVNLIKVKETVENSLPKKIKKQCSVNIEITNRLEETKEIMKADRVQIYDFHNGGHYANGRSALKTSCSYEVIRTGIKGYQKELQAVPLSCIPRFVRTLLDSGELKINNLEEIKESMPATYELKKRENVGSFYDIILNNKENEPIGFLALQYAKPGCVNFNEVEMNQILKLKFFIEENLEKMAMEK